jgi:hypothetical protein
LFDASAHNENFSTMQQISQLEAPGSKINAIMGIVNNLDLPSCSSNESIAHSVIQPIVHKIGRIENNAGLIQAE